MSLPHVICREFDKVWNGEPCSAKALLKQQRDLDPYSVKTSKQTNSYDQRRNSNERKVVSRVGIEPTTS